MKRVSLVIVVMLVVMSLVSGVVQVSGTWAEETAPSQPGCLGTNLLTNPDFEGEYTTYIMPPPGHPDCQTWDPLMPNQTCERAQMPAGWAPYWRDDPRPETWINIMPEYTASTPDQVNPDRVMSGDRSLHYFSFWSTHEGGAYQQVTAVPGGLYCFSVYGHSWSARTSTDWYSDPDPDNGELFQKVGIDPTGGTDWTSPDIIWSDERKQYDLFGLFAVEAAAQADTITVFLYSRPNIPVKHNDVYWDNATLTVPQMQIQTSQIGVLADDDIPRVVTQTVVIDLTAGFTWTASLDTAGTITPVLSMAEGDAGQNLAIILDSTGYLSGTYTNTLTISSAADVVGSPAEIPVVLWVVPEVSNVYLPAIMKP
ncbi:MAG: hypothetical protein H6667_07950 [Ardenticatenaceae bacterium]|nr:hypothetical protein [Ardenticatenaceae bacterium]MCB9444652.1 hypothetical protein [Ardenticatenaceae bacterium]